jgi:hypothetical protein
MLAAFNNSVVSWILRTFLLKQLHDWDGQLEPVQWGPDVSNYSGELTSFSDRKSAQSPQVLPL